MEDHPHQGVALNAERKEGPKVRACSFAKERDQQKTIESLTQQLDRERDQNLYGGLALDIAIILAFSVVLVLALPVYVRWLKKG